MQYLKFSLKICKFIGLFIYDLYIWTEILSGYSLVILDFAELNFIYVYVSCKHSHVV